MSVSSGGLAVASQGVVARRFTITAKLAAIVVVFVTIIGALLAIVAVSLHIDAGVRAYVGGEGLWSKGQKDAVYYLMRYARSHDEADYAKYEAAISVPLGDHQARLELEKPDYDYGVVEDGFVRGGIPREDVPSMVFLFRRFREVSYLASAIQIWAAADAQIVRLVACAEELHRTIRAGRLDAARERELLDRIEAINAKVTPLEHDFSATLGDGARWVSATLKMGILIGAALLLVGGLWVAWTIARGLRAGILSLREGAIRVAAGDLGHPIEVGSGDELGELAVVFNDMISHRAAAEQALRAATDFRDKVMSSTTNAIHVFDAAGRFTMVNRRTCEMTGYSAEELLGSSYSRLIPPDRIADADELFSRAARGEGSTSDYEIPLVRKDGRTITITFSNAPLIGEGRIMGVVGTAEDVTEQRRAREEIRRARDEALEASRARSEFLASMSHEIRTPMNAIIGLTGLLLDTELKPEQREFAQIARSSAESLLALVNDILDFSKIDAGKLAIEPIPFDLEVAAAEALGLMSSAAKAKAIDLVFRYEPTAPRNVVGDPGRIRQILTNLMSNAVKFTEQGSVLVEVDTKSRSGNAAVFRFRVVDTGIGIAPHAQERIFQKFVQADASTTRQYGGTGLGLAISKQLVELMGGEIGVTSEAGEGSTFWFTLPLPLGPQRGEETRAADARPIVVNGAIQARVLVVEDNPVNQQVARMMVQKMGCRIDTAANGKEAVEMVRSIPYDIVFMDCQMPEMDGYAATRAIRLLEAGKTRVPIVALTAHAMDGDRERCLKAGMDDYVTKPIRADALREALLHWVQRKPAVVGLDPEFRENLRTWREEDGEEAARDLVAIFLRTTRDHLASLKSAIGSGDLTEAKLLTHGLKGSCATFGAMKLSRVSQEFERALVSKAEERFSPLMGELEESFRVIESELAVPS